MQVLKTYFKSAQRGRIGLDIGSGAVRLLGLGNGPSGWTATCAAWSDIAPYEDDTRQYAHTLEAVRDCINQVSNQSLRHVVCGLSGQDAIVRSFSFPVMPLAELEKAIHFEAQQVCPMEMQSSVLDYQLLQPAAAEGRAGGKLSGILVAGAKEAIDRRYRLTQEAGIKASLIDADGLATLNCLSELDDLDRYQTVALIDLGLRCTRVISLGSSGIPFIRDLNTGLRTLTEEICRVTEYDAASVQAMLWAEAIAQMPDAALMAYHKAVRPLIMSINETLKYYASQEKGLFAEKVYLCGGGALVRTFVELLSDSLPAEVAVFDPFETIQTDTVKQGAELLTTRGTAFTTAAGLAMRTI